MTVNVNFDLALDILGLTKDQNFNVTFTPEQKNIAARVDDSGSIHGLNYVVTSDAYSYTDTNIQVTENVAGDAVVTTVDANAVDYTYQPNGDFEYVPSPFGIRPVSATATVKFSSALSSKSYSQYNSEGPKTATSTFVSYVSGSLAAHVHDAFAAMISGETPGVDTQEYWLTNNGDVDNPVAVRNPNRFTKTLDMSATSAMQTDKGADGTPCHLITERHVIFAWHTGSIVGKKIVFQNQNGDFETVSCSSVQRITGLVTDEDLAIGLLDAPMTLIQPYSVMPVDWVQDYVPIIGFSHPVSDACLLPTVAKVRHNADDDPANWLSMNDCIELRQGSLRLFYSNALSGPIKIPLFEPWWNEVIEGDSGSGTVVPVNGNAVLLMTLHRTNSSNDIPTYKELIEEAMNNLAGVAPGTYELNHADLTAFTKYS